MDGEQSSSNLVDGFGQTVDVVTVACRGQYMHTVNKTTEKPQLLIVALFCGTISTVQNLKTEKSIQDQNMT